MALAKQYNAIYQKTSAKNGNGIEELFTIIGKKFLNPNLDDESNLTKKQIIEKINKLKREEIIRMENNRQHQQKSWCC